VHRVARDRSAHVMDMIRPWVNESIREEHLDELSSIFIAAFRLNQILQQQRAIWSIRFPSKHGSPQIFDQTSMSDVGEDGGGEGHKTVELIVTPALWKRGNADGQRMEHEFCLERANVTCRQVLKAPVPTKSAESKGGGCCVIL
jgi:hypothetical protein